MTFEDAQVAATAVHLRILGGFHPTPEDRAPHDCKTLLLLGPDEPAFWPQFCTSPEYLDGAADPMDRWSVRVVGALAADLDAAALYPFGGPPFAPFYSWALRTGRMHAAPINFLVHDRAGLFVSFRGALAFQQRLSLPSAPATPCTTCMGQPCATACPVGALRPEGYDVVACKQYLDTPSGQDCMQLGCRARRACPVSQKFGRLAAQSEFHMRQFKGPPG
ncbi:hypothetical protein SAMN04488523_101432 [Sulfitobacter brevis]|uniref:4Fe-4S ferredoxin-type domain-containing protein n=1 Tax=Sulfitobacter brevis TaxID=74348 RepID=A0A1I1TLR9_9RHOB|nr:ferredoxin [Sulfitobacter brevis]SFD59449.1 hypothetical protein SAMN04488523_101432 [Sulfitobacter brevis]